MSDLRRLLFANQTRAYEGYPLVISRSVALRYLKQYQMYGNSQQGVPAGYTPLEYIESSGTQYIDLGVSGNATLIGTAQSTTDNPTTSQVFVSNSGATAGHWFGVQSPTAGAAYAKRWGLGATPTASSTISGTTKVNFEITFTQSSQYGTVNDQTLTRESSAVTHTDWIAFAGATTPAYGFIGKVWELKVEQNDILVRNLIPAKRNSDSVIGMYDTVSGQFFTNSGTGTFTAGPVLPTPENPVDVISVGDKTKNLFDKNNRTRIYGFFSSTGTTWTYNASAYSNKIPCKPNTTYTARYNGNSTQAVLGFGSCSTDDEPSSIGDVTVTQGIRKTSPTINTPVTITTGANDKWLIVAYNVAEPQNTDMANNLQIEEGSTATSYVPYGYQIPVVATGTSGSPITTPIYLSNPLRKVGTYSDVLSYDPQQVIRNVEITVFDGTENWAASNTYQGSCWLNLPTNSQQHICLCTHFDNVSSLSSYTRGKVYNEGYAINIWYGDNKTTAVAEFKAFLAQQYANGTPVILLRALTTPVTESIVAPALPTMAGSTTYTTETEVKPSNMKGVF